MHDYESAIWAEHHRIFSDAVATLFRQIAVAFDRLQHIRFDAPWNAAPPPNRCG